MGNFCQTLRRRPGCLRGIRQDAEEEEEEEETGEDIAEAMSSCCSSNLPGDLMLDFLKRLPVKSLLRFKCVCKTWKKIVESPTFINMHLVLQYSNKKQSMLLRAYNHGVQKNYICKFSSGTVRYSHDDMSLPFRPSNPRFVQIIGSSNGLVCIGQRKLNKHKLPFGLWNPATRAFRFLPLSRPLANRNLFPFFAFQFSYLHAIDDYKLVCMTSNEVKYDSSIDKEQHINLDTFTLSKNSWSSTRVVINPRVTTTCYLPTLVNGYLHWSGIRRDRFGKDEKIVFSFDMTEEIFHQTSIPCSPNLKINLARLNENLVMFAHSFKKNLNGEPIEIWITNHRCDATGSWTKHLTIEFLPIIYVGLPVGFWLNDEEILFSNAENYSSWENNFLYDYRTRLTSYIPRFKGVHNDEFIPHVDSLVSVKRRAASISTMKSTCNY